MTRQDADLIAANIVDRLTPAMVEREPETIKAWIAEALMSETACGQHGTKFVLMCPECKEARNGR